MQLTDDERAFASGAHGAAVALSMRIVTEMGRVLGAERLIPIASAHIDGCLYHGPAGVQFAERLVEGRGRVAVPATLNVGAIDLQRPDRMLLDATERDLARRLMRAYEALGCAPTWTCAPYQAGHRPRLGEDIAWAESNAVVFVNSVLGARTNRYGDFMDIACALTGRAPQYGLHLARNRRAVLVADVGAISERLKAEDSFFPVLGAWLGQAAGEAVAVIEGLPATTSEDQLKALGAAAASTGSVALFHVAGVTPEARTLSDALQGETPAQTMIVTPDMLRTARDRLSTVASEALDVIALGSPHFSELEFAQLERRLNGRRSRIPIYACTGRHVGDELIRSGRAAALAGQGVEIVVDTCVVATPILTGKPGGVLMTNSGKFAHYGPSNTGYEAVYGSLEDCVESAVAGHVIRNEELWR